ncbi:helix-turn-helix domain-containing protein [Myxococcus xanthus]|uniref:Helix-turn-helix domain-containing protein n=1 Tax=Myxococcus xanthus TaxID=34 RepID=A0A7Y4MUH4_MYXXA|nr:helix-turn-helix domain-containing protein [Myxococcus xanthus]NOJ81598.1 helix-turn-helix domain-containing protein [Myxococcus xanthus]NOJ89046.1 helix-turn-helix domain-containing protein [Myxococcus xanthus]
MSAPSPETQQTTSSLDLASTVGANARAARLRLSLTQANVAQRVGLASAVYSRLERGRMLPSVRTLYRLATVLCTSPDALLGHGFNAEPPPDSPSVRLLVQQVRRLDERQVKALLRLIPAMR